MGQPMERDTGYYRARVAQEMEAAGQAPDTRARNRHLELAAAYTFRIRELVAQERRSAFRLVGEGSLTGPVELALGSRFPDRKSTECCIDQPMKAARSANEPAKDCNRAWAE